MPERGGADRAVLIFSFFFIKEKGQKENHSFNIENRTARGGFRSASSQIAFSY
jgi:hypothetical protein